MKQILRKEKGLLRATIWFNEKQTIDAYANQGVDLLEFRESRISLGAGFKPFRNGVIGLDANQDEIFASLTKGFKYEVRRAQKEGVSVGSASPPDRDGFNNAFASYEGFSSAKALSMIPRGVLVQYRESGNLSITWAALSGADAPLQYHVYFHDEQEAILLASFPASENSGIESKLYGFANRLLHWEDMLLFKRMGLSRYNLGGVGNPGSSGNENIQKFKLEMSPIISDYYHAIVPVTWKARMYFRLRRIIKGGI